MDLNTYTQLIIKYEHKLSALSQGKILLVANLINGGLLHDSKCLQDNAACFSDDSVEALEALVQADFPDSYTGPVVIDMTKAVTLYRESSEKEDERIKTALLMSRVNFMGTDGIRGKVVLKTNEHCIADLLKDNAFTPGLVEITAFSFAKLLVDNEIVKADDTVIIGNDGRDKAYDWRLNRAVIDGFNRAQLQVLDLGVVPTALVPYMMLKKGCRGAAMLTASHNPSNQNGIKFFIDGKKLLPEGTLGDYALSMYMYTYCLCEPMPEKISSHTPATNVTEEGERFVLSVLPENTAGLLRDTFLVLDTANGAFTNISNKVLDTLGVSRFTRNEEPAGANINRDCGVAEIEGTELFEAAGYENHIPFIQEMFDRGREREAGKVFGIALDGDGDRGFLLYYDRHNDRIHVIDGDKCGYILADYFIKAKGLNPTGYWFISTIESDIMTAASAQKYLGLNTKIVSVGDKWIGNFDEGDMLVGLEVSGHIIFPVTFKNDNGKEVTLYSGIGLLTGLLTLVAIKELNLPAEKITEPFEPGISKTSYVFFVDKSKFYNGSSVWNSDRSMVEKEVRRLKKEGMLPDKAGLVFEDKEDPNVLYINLVEGKDLLGCIFMRNSGTEDKTATYVKGKAAVKEALFSLSKKIQENHAQQMKNTSRIEYTWETIIINTLKQNREILFEDIKNTLEKETQSSINENDLYSVIHSLRKEDRILFENQVLKLVYRT